MGERVVVNPSSEPERPIPAVPLDYAGPRASRLWLEKAMGVLTVLGGWRQIVFALGLAFSFAGIGQLFVTYRNSEAIAVLFIGGLLIGLALRLPWLKG